MMSDNYCPEREEATGESETHCYHETGNVAGRPPYREECCCFCGRSFLGSQEPQPKHGPHRPLAVSVSRGKVIYDTTDKPKMKKVAGETHSAARSARRVDGRALLRQARRRRPALRGHRQQHRRPLPPLDRGSPRWSRWRR